MLFLLCKFIIPTLMMKFSSNEIKFELLFLGLLENYINRETKKTSSGANEHIQALK